jgi:hypothetical protein
MDVLVIKSDSVEKALVYKFSPYSKFDFSFPVSLCLPFFKLSFSVFDWELAEPVFCSEALTCLPYKNQNKSLTLSSLLGKFKFALW